MRTILIEFYRGIKKYKWEFAKTTFWILLISFLNAFIPYIFKKYLEYSVSSNDTKPVLYFLLFFFVFVSFKTLAKILWYRSLDTFGGRYLCDTICECQNKLVNDSFLNDIQKDKNTKLKHVLYVDALNTFTTLGHHLPSLVCSLLVIITIFVISFFINTLFSIIIFAAIVIGIIISVLSKKFIVKASAHTNKHLKAMNFNSSSFLECVEIGKMNHLNDYFEEKSRRCINEFIKAAKIEDTKTYFWAGLSDGYNLFITYFISALLALPFFDGTIVSYAFFTLICSIALEESQMLISNLRLIFKSQASFDNINNVLTLPKDNREVLGKIDTIHGKIENFVIEDKTILKDIDFDFKKGDLIRIEGPNGSGKSTLVKIIAGLYNNENIHYGNITKCNPTKRMLFIDQNEAFLNETVLKYLSIVCHKDLKNDELQNLCETLNFDCSILNKQIENYGDNLSNGERKKISLLRFFIVKDDVDVIILDEIMAGLDVESRDIVTKKFLDSDFLKEKICIIIEHENELRIPFTKTISL